VSYSDFNLYFGDLHAHSNVSTCGVCSGRDVLSRDLYIHSSVIKEYLNKRLSDEETIESLYSFAKEEIGLDFVAVTDHDFTMSDDTWRYMQRKAYEWYEPDKFVTFSAYEWTSRLYGHRNVYYLSDTAPIFRCIRYDENGVKKFVTPNELWRFLKENNIKALTIPHHPSLTQFPVNWDYYNPEFDKVVEIVSIWGIFEYFGNPFQCMTSDNLPRYFALDALERGYRLGFVGGSDSHDCRPGDKLRPIRKRNLYRDFDMNSLSQIFVPYFVHNPLGVGLTAIYAKNLTREAIFDAISKKRVYATIGEKIKLEFYVDNRLMGEEITVRDLDHKPMIRVNVESPKKIDRIEVIRNGKVIFQNVCLENTCSVSFRDEKIKPSRKYNYYYVRVILRNGSRAWSSPIWVIYEVLGKINVKIDEKNKRISFFKTGVIPPRIKVAFVDKLIFMDRFLESSYIVNRIDYGAFFSITRTSIDEVILRIRFKDIKKSNYRGYIKLYGFNNYMVKPFNFAIIKYGGDLFLDDYHGFIKWDVTVNSRLNDTDVYNVKGLDIYLRINPFEKVYGISKILHDGRPDSMNTYVNGKKINAYPFEVILNQPLDKYKEVLIDNKFVENIPPSSRYMVLYPATYDEHGVRAEVYNLKN